MTSLTWNIQVDSTALRPFAFRSVSDVSTRHLYGTISGIQAPFSFGVGTRLPFESPGANFDLPDTAWDSLQFAFSPASIGTFRDTLVLSSNANPPNDNIKLFLIGTATARTGGAMPEAEISSTSLPFLGDSVGTFTQQYTVLANHSAVAPLHVTFAHTPNAPYTVSGQMSIVDTMKYDTLLFSFAPTIGGKFTDSLVMLTDAAAPHNHLKITLTGTALSAGVSEASAARGLKLIARTVSGSGILNVQISGMAQGRLNLNLFDESGVKVATLLTGLGDQGTKSIQYSTRALAEGVYFLRLESQSGTALAKVVLRR